MKIASLAAIAALAAVIATPVASYDSVEEANAAGAKICAAAPADFPKGEIMSAETLKKHFTDLGLPLDGRNLESIDSSCGVMTKISGFAAMPRLHLGNNNKQDVAMDVKISGRNGECMAVIVSLDGC